MMRILNVGDKGNPVMDWSFSFDNFAAASATDYYRRKDPVFIHDDPLDTSSFYLSGYYQGAGSIMKFQKRNAKLRWWLSFPKMTRINSVVNIPSTDSFLACGHYWVNEDTTQLETDTKKYQTSAVIMKVKNDGQVLNYLSISGTNPVPSTVSQDECWGVTAKKDGSFSAVLSIKMTQLRDSTKGDFKDVLLIIFNSSGAVTRAVVFSQGSIAQNMNLASNALINIDD
jgi:hypothetical protein